MEIDYLRLSMTDRCNLDCMYCNPLEKGRFLSRNEVLRYEEIARLVNVFVSLGIRKVRITGGEPLIKRNITDLIKMLKEIQGIEELVGKIKNKTIPKGDVLESARIAGIMACKRTSEIIPLCHNIEIACVDIEYFFRKDGLLI